MTGQRLHTPEYRLGQEPVPQAAAGWPS